MLKYSKKTRRILPLDNHLLISRKHRGHLQIILSHAENIQFMSAKNTGSRFLQLTIPLFSILFGASLLFTKTESFVALNTIHSEVLNRVFITITFMGDGLFPLLVTVIALMLKKYDLGIKVFISFLASGLTAQLLKSIFHAPRPMALLTSIHYHYPYFINGITHSGLNSFPSGHTTTVFALAATLAFNTSCKYRCIIYFTLATLTLYSRIYLGQHFLEDTAAGLFIGTAIAFLGEALYKRFNFKVPVRKPHPHHELLSIDI